MRDDFIYGDEEFDAHFEEKENKKGKRVTNKNLNLIINKSALLNDYIKSEEEKTSMTHSAGKSSKKEFSFTEVEQPKQGNIYYLWFINIFRSK